MSEEVKTIKLVNTETPEETAHLVEREDEKAILQEEMTGELLQSLVYIGKDGKPVLSYAGIKEGARRFKNIRYGVSKVEETPEYIIAYGYAKNLADNIEIEIPKRQSKKLQLKDGSTVTDEFAYEKACAKAIRNAIKGVIPIQYFQFMIKAFMEQEPQQQNGKKYEKDKTDEFQKHNARIQKMRNGLNVIFDKTSIKDERLREDVCIAVMNKAHTSNWTDEEVEHFYSTIAGLLKKERLSLRELTDNEYDQIKQYLLDTLIASQKSNPQLYREGE